MVFLIVCAVVAVILIASRINAWSNGRPDRRYIVVSTPEGRKVTQSPPATMQRADRAATQARTTARGSPQQEPAAAPNEEAPSPTPTAPQSPAQPADASLGDPEPAIQSSEPLNPLDMLSPKIAQVPPEMAARVVALMNKGQEVSAVRLLCDELRIGILDAQKTARSLAGR